MSLGVHGGTLLLDSGIAGERRAYAGACGFGVRALGRGQAVACWSSRSVQSINSALPRFHTSILLTYLKRAVAAHHRPHTGGHKGAKAAAPFKRLPFHCCAINFTPFEDPVCTDDGTVYDIASIVPYIMKFKKHPVSGEPLALKDLTRLNFSKNGDGEWNCPVMGKVTDSGSRSWERRHE